MLSTINVNSTMSLPATLTLNVGSSPADIVFTKAMETPKEVTYYGPASEGNLLSRPSLRISRETTGTGVMRTLVQAKFPDQTDLGGRVTGFATANVTLIRRPEGETESQRKTLESSVEAVSSLLTTLVADVF